MQVCFCLRFDELEGVKVETVVYYVAVDLVALFILLTLEDILARCTFSSCNGTDNVDCQVPDEVRE